jgi:hypothetical protein
MKCSPYARYDCYKKSNFYLYRVDLDTLEVTTLGSYAHGYGGSGVGGRGSLAIVSETTIIPAPGALELASIGFGFVSLLIRRFNIKLQA